MGQIKNIKLHIVTDIKVTIYLFQFRIFVREIAGASKHDRGFLLLGTSLGFGCCYAAWYTYYLAAYGAEVSYLRGTNEDPYTRYPTTYQNKLYNRGELNTKDLPRAGPAEAWEAIGIK